jgi:prephenate dehydrogenase
VKIGIIGAGAVGTAIAKYALLTGHQMALASRRRDKLTETVTVLGNGASVATISDAAAADIVILAVPWPAREETLSAIPDWEERSWSTRPTHSNRRHRNSCLPISEVVGQARLSRSSLLAPVL